MCQFKALCSKIIPSSLPFFFSPFLFPPSPLSPSLSPLLSPPPFFLSPSLPPSSFLPSISVYLSQFKNVASSRGLLLSILTSALLGDQLAAEYTLLHLLASVYGRTDLMALGKFSLNLTHCSPSLSLTRSLSSLLKQLLPLVK